MITDVVRNFFSVIEGKKGPLLSIDFGLKNVGIAISNDTMTIAMPLTILENNALLADKIAAILLQYSCVGVVMGWPVDLRGGVHRIGKNILFLCGNLYKMTALPILLWDESMSTRLAVARVYELNTEHGDRFIKKVGRGRDDHLAAQFILDQVLSIVYGSKG